MTTTVGYLALSLRSYHRDSVADRSSCPQPFTPVRLYGSVSVRAGWGCGRLVSGETAAKQPQVVRVVCVAGPMFVPFLCGPVYVAAAAGETA